MNIRTTIRPLPYYTVSDSRTIQSLARSLRMEFVPKISRRLPMHHLSGLRHDAIIKFVKRHKKRYPCFVRTDISKFYPSIVHRDLLVGMQLAYRDLLGLDYVPKAFKTRYVKVVNTWLQSLPLHTGIPLGSSMSALLAPLMLVPLWLDLKRRYHVPFVVYMDDVLVLCEDEHACAEIYAFISNRLHEDYSLSLNLNKTVSGRFSRQRVVFCGWNFSGGYANISMEKVASFKERFVSELAHSKGLSAVHFFKRVNRKIDGFGNYYKHGDVCRQFRELDTFIRREVRRWFSAENRVLGHSNDALCRQGLHSLVLCYEKVHRMGVKQQPTPGYNLRAMPQAGRDESVDDRVFDALTDSVSKIGSQLTQLIALQRKQLRLLESVI